MEYLRRLTGFLTLCATCALTHATHEEETETDEHNVILVVDLSSNTLEVIKDGELIKTFYKIEHGKIISSVPRSKGTPLITCLAAKEYGHSFGPVFRLCGSPEGEKQGKRGILIHRDMTRNGYTSGCIALDNYTQMRSLYKMTPDVVWLEIKK